MTRHKSVLAVVLLFLLGVCGLPSPAAGQSSCSRPDFVIPVNSPSTSFVWPFPVSALNGPQGTFPTTYYTNASASINVSWVKLTVQQPLGVYGQPGAMPGFLTFQFNVSGQSVGCYPATLNMSWTASYVPAAPPCPPGPVTTVCCSGLIVGSGSDSACVNNASGQISVYALVVANTQAMLIDPVPDLVNGSAVQSASQLQASLGVGKVVKGVAADGVAQVIVRLDTISANHQFMLTLYTDQNVQSSSPNDYGALGNPGDVSFSASSITISSGNADANGVAYAFAVYRAPIDFARSGGQDNSAASRPVSINVQDVTSGSPITVVSIPLQILRPPVVLIHGLWSNAGAWNNFSPLVSGKTTVDARFSVARVSFDYPVALSTSDPTYSVGLANASANTLGIQYNTPNILTTVKIWIDQFRSGQNPVSIPVAAVQADVVAHSMGGIITRTMPLLPQFFNSGPTFGQGLIHKVITIDTPHLGTPLASSTELLGSTSDCTRELLAQHGDYSFASVNGSISGAIADLQPNSAPIKAIAQAGPQPLPTALIAGVYTNFSALDCTVCAANYIRSHCGGSGDALANQLTSSAWPLIFGSAGNNANDGVVSETSQLNGLATSSGFVYSGLLHSSSLENLSFTGPSVLDPSSASNPIPNQVITLLNTQYTQPAFNSLNP